MTVNFSGLTNIPGKTIISPLPDPPPEPIDFYKDTITKKVTSPTTSVLADVPPGVIEDDLMVLYHITSDDVTQSLVNPVVQTIVNPGGETGDTTGWTNELGGLAVRTNSPSPFAGSYYFFGGPNVQTRARQDIVVPANLITEVDAGLLTANLRWYQNSFAGNDQAEMEIEFYDGLPGSIIGVKTAAGLTAPIVWTQRTLSVAVPTLTRTIRIFYHGVRSSGTNLDGDIDAITLDLTGSITVGWIPLWQNVQVANECTTSCYQKIAVASEPLTVQVGSNSSEQHITIVSTFGGVDLANPINAFNNATNASASTSVVAPTVTTTQGSTMLYVLGAAGGFGEPGDLEPDHWNFPAGVIERDESVVSMDGQQSTLDFSSNGYALSFAGTAQLDTASKQSGNASLELSGLSNVYVSVPGSTSWDFGTADFTLECHANIDVNQNSALLGRGSFNASHRWVWFIDPSGNLEFWHSFNQRISSSINISSLGWTHFALSRNSGVTRMYAAGVQIGSTATVMNITASSQVLQIGKDPEQLNRTVDGHIDNVRITKGVGRYPDGTLFSPPSGPLSDDANVELLVPFDEPILPFGAKAAVGTEFIPFSSVTGTRIMTIDKAQAAQSGSVAIARQL